MAVVRQRHWGEVNRPDTGVTQVRVYVWELPVRVSHWLIVLPLRSYRLLAITSTIHSSFRAATLPTSWRRCGSYTWLPGSCSSAHSS